MDHKSEKSYVKTAVTIKHSISIIKFKDHRFVSSHIKKTILREIFRGF